MNGKVNRGGIWTQNVKGLNERFSTYFTVKGFFSSVTTTNVDNKMRILSERFATYFTMEWFFSSVTTFVDNKMKIINKYVRIFGWWHSIVNCWWVCKKLFPYMIQLIIVIYRENSIFRFRSHNVKINEQKRHWYNLWDGGDGWVCKMPSKMH